MNTLSLDYYGLPVVATADSEGDLIWLQEFLGPVYRSVAAGGVGAPRRIGLHSDPLWSRRRQSMAEQEASGALGSVLAHVLDASDLRLPCVREADDTLLVWDARFECCYQQCPDAGTTLLHAAGPERSRRPRLAWMRAVRELALHHELRRGSLALHASGLVRQGRALLFAGPRRAGKTTLLSACLDLVPGLELLANDRVMVHPQDGGWRCRGMASVVSVRPGDETLLPGLRQRLHRNALGPEAGPQESRAREFSAHERLYLSPSQYSNSFGVPMVAEGRLAAIVLPRIDPAVAGLRWQPLRASAEVLAGVLFAAGHPGSRSELFDCPDSGPFPGEATRQRRLQALAGTVACYELVVGVDAYRAETLQGLLDAALGGI
jgi:hypothetical protein